MSERRPFSCVTSVGASGSCHDATSTKFDDLIKIRKLIFIANQNIIASSLLYFQTRPNVSCENYIIILQNGV